MIEHIYPKGGVVCNPHTEILRMIRKQGPFKEIGKGAYAHVYGSTKHNHVYKVGSVDDNFAYLKYVNFILSHPKNPFLPKIYGVRYYYPCQGANESRAYFVVAMEHLVPLAWSEPHSSVPKTLDFCVKNATESSAAVLGMKVIMPNNLKRVVKFLDAICNDEGSDCGLDLQRGNVMMRGKQIVITDPVC